MVYQVYSGSDYAVERPKKAPTKKTTKVVPKNKPLRVIPIPKGVKPTTVAKDIKPVHPMKKKPVAKKTKKTTPLTVSKLQAEAAKAKKRPKVTKPVTKKPAKEKVDFKKEHEDSFKVF